MLSSEADATSWPSGEKATALTLLEWPLSTLRHDAVAASHTRTVLSYEADATSWLSGGKATALTTQLATLEVDLQAAYTILKKVLGQLCIQPTPDYTLPSPSLSDLSARRGRQKQT